MTRMRRVPLPEGQAELLEMIAKGLPLKDTLERLALVIEAQSDGMFCSILLLDEDGVHIHPIAAPNMPAVYAAALEGLSIGPAVGSCGTAMYTKEAVIVTDILTDPLWAPYKQLLEPHGFRACWSTPIFLNRDAVLGSFAMYYREVRSPGPFELELMSVASHIAGIAIERTRNEETLRRYQQELEDLVRERTAELRAEKEKAETTALALAQSNLDLAAAFNTLNFAQEELVRNKKLAALGSLVAGIAHELNTPIGNCKMASSTLADETRLMHKRIAGQDGMKRSDLLHYLDDAAKAGDMLSRNLDRAADLITSFKQVAVDQTSSSRRAFDLRETVAQILQTLKPRLDDRPLDVAQDIPCGLQFDSYPGSLGQVLHSLIENARVHAFEGRDGGRIAISAGTEKAGWVELRVHDDGVGIADCNIDRIFDPFFTTKFGTGSLGLGLNIAHNIVVGVLGGQLKVQSAPQDGTLVTITLPTVAPDLQTKAEPDFRSA